MPRHNYRVIGQSKQFRAYAVQDVAVGADVTESAADTARK